MSDESQRLIDILRGAARNPVGFQLCDLLDRSADLIEQLGAEARSLAVERDDLAAQLGKARDELGVLRDAVGRLEAEVDLQKYDLDDLRIGRERLKARAKALALERDGLLVQFSEARDDAAMAFATMVDALRAMGQLRGEKETLKAEVDRLRSALHTLVRAYVAETVRPVPDECLPDYRFRVVLGGGLWSAGTNAWFGERAAAEAAVLGSAGLPADVLEGMPRVVETTADPAGNPEVPSRPNAATLPDRWQDRLAIDPHVSRTSPCVKGTWVTADRVVSLVVDGWTYTDIMRAQPELTEDDIRACLAYAIAEEEGKVSRPGADPDEVVVRYDDSDPYAHWEC